MADDAAPQGQDYTINDAVTSKINWTAVGTAATSLLVAFGLPLDDHMKALVAAVVGVAGPAAIVVFRTYFTKKPARKA